MVIDKEQLFHRVIKEKEDMDQTQCIELNVINSPTVLMRVVQIIKRRRINIKSFFAEESHADPEDATIKIVVEADRKRARLLKSQFEKAIDVVTVR